MIVDKPIDTCSVCNGEIYAGEIYGTFGGKVICRDCLNAEWDELSDGEKARALGYSARQVLEVEYGT